MFNSNNITKRVDDAISAVNQLQLTGMNYSVGYQFQLTATKSFMCMRILREPRAKLY